MFGYQGGESAETVARKRNYMRDAQQRWGSLTTFDLSGIKNAAQLTAIVAERLSLPKAQVASDVEAWMQDKQF